MQSALLEPKRSVAGRDFGALNLLVLEDVEFDRWRLRRCCRKAGLNAKLFEADSLDAFRLQLDARPYDIAFVDYFLPEGTGFEALQTLSAHGAQRDAVPILLTGMERQDLAEAARRFHCAEFLHKGNLSAEVVRCSITAALWARDATRLSGSSDRPDR